MYCTSDVSTLNLASSTESPALERSQLAQHPDIVVSTPSRLLAHLEAQALDVSTSLDMLVMDEADLVTSFGYEDDVKRILEFMPAIYQSFLASATLGEDVMELKKLMLRNPVVLKIDQNEDDAKLLTQYCIRSSEKDKFLIIYVILKLKLIKGKVLVFVNDVDRCYKLKLFLEKFSIRSCVLNSELPLNSRYHIVEEFNSGVYNVVIATDEANLKGEGDELEEGVEKEEEKEESGKKRKRVVVKDKEYGAARGVDFKDVAAVVNFDFPASARAYAHRIGRTARAGNAGMSLSFVVPTDADSKEDLAFKTQKKKRGEQEDDETVLSRVETQQKALGRDLKPYAFDMKQIEGFRYRMEDALDSISRVVIKQARLKELKAEIINSDKLKTHFEDRPKDLAFLRHDKTVFPTQVLSHLKNVPKYLMPRVVAPSSATQEEPSKTFVPFHKHKPGKKGVKKRRNDPLKSFKRSKHT